MLSAFKNFFVTLLIALAIFGVGAYFAVSFVTNTMHSILTSEKEQLNSIIEKDDHSGAEEGDEPGTPVNPDDLIEGESFSFLLVITDYRPDLYGDYMPAAVRSDDSGDEEKNEDPYGKLGYLSADYRSVTASAIVLVCADKEREQYTYTYFSPESRLYTPAGYHTLGDAYSYYGASVLTEHIHALTGIMPDYQMTLNGYNLDEIVSFLGAVNVNLTKDIYFDGKQYTTQSETVLESVDKHGKTTVERIPNTFALSAGTVELDEESAFILASLSERSMADINAKESYTVDAVRQYLTKLGGMDESALKFLVSLLTLKESEWDTIEKDETTAESESGSAEGEVLPWEETEEAEIVPAETEAPETESPETEESEETAEGDTDEDAPETVYLFEPDTPILETRFTAADLEKIGGVLKAISLFDQVTVSYPGNYVSKTEDHGAYFDLNTKTGLPTFFMIRPQKNASGEQ